MKKIVRRIMTAAAVVMLAASMLPMCAFAETTSKPKPVGDDEIKYYTMDYKFKKGDTLSKVYNLWGLKYETYAEDIKRINGISNLDVIYVDKVLRLPTTASNLQNDEYITVMSHKMEKGETVADVCDSYDLKYSDMESKIKAYSGLKDLTKVNVGTEILIPIH